MIRQEQCNKVCRILDDVLANRPTERDSLILAVRKAFDALEKQRWIPCSERLPRQGQEVICRCRANIIKVLKLDADGDWYQDAEHCYMSGFVVAWMPLPEVYKGEQE
jgi:hypothetical protein